MSDNAMPYGNRPKDIMRRRLKAYTDASIPASDAHSDASAPAGREQEEEIPPHEQVVWWENQFALVQTRNEELTDAMERIVRGGTSVLIHAALNDDPINPEVLQQIVSEASAALSSQSRGPMSKASTVTSAHREDEA